MFPIAECFSPVIYLYLDCVGRCKRIPRSVPRGLILESLQSLYLKVDEKEK